MVISHNIKGLNIPEKRASLLRELKKGRPKFVLLQETHFRTNQIPRLTNTYFNRAYHATNDLAKTKGVTILLSKDNPFILTDRLSDPEGRFIFIKGKYGNGTVTLANVYFPNVAQVAFCQRVTHELKGFAAGTLIMGGDFNVPFNPTIDSSNGKSCITYRALKTIKRYLNSLQLVDSWRFLHPDTRDFTFHSVPHDRYSRIDYIYISQRDLQKVKGAHIGIQTISDHAPISLDLDLLNTPPRTNTWRLNTSLLTDPDLLPRIREAISEFFSHNNTPDMDPMMIWEAHKCTIRGELIKLGAQRKKKQEKELKDLTDKIINLETAHKQSLAIQTATELLEARKKLQDLFHIKTQRSLFFKKRIYYESGDKTGRFLARALREACSTSVISGIRSPEGVLEVTSDAIASQFHTYYSKLYNLTRQNKPHTVSTDRSQAIHDYLTDSGLPRLETDETTPLEEQISLTEILGAIKGLKPGKSPGPDGYTSAYYKTFSDILSDPLRKALNSLSTPRQIPTDFLAAHITVIHKTGKDPTECPNYRPISLLNLDLKILTKILANRLQPLLSHLIGHDQVGFMQGREARDNIMKALLLTHAAHSQGIEGLLLSTDAEKAFDRVSWDYMLGVCRHVGLGSHMLTWITALYQNPSARIKVNGTLSDKVMISNGTRQGCPLSPLLFILSLEPFIRKVNRNESISGFKVDDKIYKIAAYADDLLFFLTKPHTTIPNLMEEFTTYGFISNLKINYSKSEAMNLTLPENTLARTQGNCKFRWVADELKYLGVGIPSNLSKTFEKNFPPMLKGIASDLRSWNSKFFSWFGRAAILKMVILPRLLYLLRSLPVEIPLKFFKQLQAILTGFLWGQGRPRVKFSLLTRPKKRGGMGLPHFFNYYLASHLTRVIDWHCHRKSKHWVQLEESLTPGGLRFSPWIPWGGLHKSTQKHPMTGVTLKAFQTIIKKFDLTTQWCPVTPLQNNPDFVPGQTGREFRALDTSKLLTAGDCIRNGKIKDYLELKEETNTPHLSRWSYFQIRSFITDKTKLPHFRRPMTQLETVCHRGEDFGGATSIAYSWLQNPETVTVDRFRVEWTKALQKDITDNQWQTACSLAHKCSISTKLQETAYKLLTHWYITPYKLNKWSPEASDRCWRCEKEPGTLIHIWWQCPALENFWTEVRDIIRQITETQINLDAACCLLHISNFPYKRYKKSLTIHLLNAAKALIPTRWKNTQAPSIKEWLRKVSEICRMEDFLAQTSDSIERYHKIWTPWLLFRFSSTHDSLMNT